MTVGVDQGIRRSLYERGSGQECSGIRVGGINSRIQHGHRGRPGWIYDLIGEIPSDLGQRPLVGVFCVIGDVGSYFTLEVFYHVDNVRVVL